MTGQPGQRCRLGGESPAALTPGPPESPAPLQASSPDLFCLSELPETAWGHCCWNARGQRARQRVGWVGLPATGYLPIRAARGGCPQPGSRFEKAKVRQDLMSTSGGWRAHRVGGKSGQPCKKLHLGGTAGEKGRQGALLGKAGTHIGKEHSRTLVPAVNRDCF